MANDDLIRRLRELGGPRKRPSPLGYFSHTSGRVSLAAASRFFEQAVALAREAADALENATDQ